MFEQEFSQNMLFTITDLIDESFPKYKLNILILLHED